MKTLTKPTHIEAVRKADLTCIEQIQNLLDWTHQEYCNHQFEQYEAFCDRLFYGYDSIKTEVRYSAVFRGFWNNEWAIRNQVEFLPYAIDIDPDQFDILDEYLYIHNHQRLLNEPDFMRKYISILNNIRK